MDSQTATTPLTPTNDTKAEGQDQTTEQAIAEAAQGGQGALTKEEAREAIRKYKLKVDGEEVEVDEDELKRGYSHQRAANKRMQEAVKKERATQQLIELMKDKGGLLRAVQALGHDPRKLAEEILSEHLELETLDPVERELRMTKKQLEEYNNREQARAEAEKKKHADTLKQKFAKQYSEQFVEALKGAKLPQTKETVQRMAKYVKDYAQVGMEITAAEAAKLVYEDLVSTHRSVYKETEAEQLVRLLGEDGLKKIREYEASRLKDPASKLQTPENQPDLGGRQSRTGKRMSHAEWRAFTRR